MRLGVRRLAIVLALCAAFAAAGATQAFAYFEDPRLNGGARVAFNQAISFAITCDTQDEIDRLWDALTADGEPQMCGWLVDRYGVTWQVVPAGLGALQVLTLAFLFTVIVNIVIGTVLWVIASLLLKLSAPPR